jgi:hypothetical protein
MCGFDKLAELVFFDVLGLGFEAPPGYHAHPLHALRILVEIVAAHGEISDTVVEVAWYHRLFGKQNERAVQFESS